MSTFLDFATANLNRFIQIPKSIIGIGLRPTALILAGILHDRLAYKQLTDPTATYIEYAIDDIASDLHVNRKTVMQRLKDLVDASVIITKKIGGGQVSHISFTDLSIFSRAFVQMPKALVASDIPHVAAVAYALIRDRLSLSYRNAARYLDDQNRFYAVYGKGRLCHDLGVSEGTVSKTISILTDLRLLAVDRKGKVLRLYPAKLSTLAASAPSKNGLSTPVEHAVESPQTPGEVQILESAKSTFCPLNNPSSNPYSYSNSGSMVYNPLSRHTHTRDEIAHSLPAASTQADLRTQICQAIRYQDAVKLLTATSKFERFSPLYEQIVDVMVQAHTSKRSWYIKGVLHGYRDIRDRLSRITPAVFVDVCRAISNRVFYALYLPSQKIGCLEGYILSALYCAVDATVTRAC